MKYSFFTTVLFLLLWMVLFMAAKAMSAQPLEPLASNTSTTPFVATPPSKTAGGYPHEDEPIGNVRQVYNGALFPDIQVNTFRNTHRLFPTRLVRAGSETRALPFAKRQLENLIFKSGGKTWDLFDYLSLNRVAGIIVIKDAEIAFEQYLLGNNPATKWMSMSVVKSMVATLVGVAIRDGSISNINDPVTLYLPELAGGAYEGVSIRHLLQMSSGVGWNEAYTDPSSDRRAMLDAQISQKPGSILGLMGSLERVAEAGTLWNYSTGETQIVAALLVAATGMPVAEYLAEKIWQPFGMESDARWWLDSPDGLEIGGSGLSATLRDYARFGLYMLDEGNIFGADTLPLNWITQATQAQTIGGELVDYGYMWWPLDNHAYSAIGIFGQYIYVHPKSKTVIAMWSAQPKPEATSAINEFDFFNAVVDALP